MLALPTLILVERAWDRRWITDDGFINLRIARMMLGGHGPVFNVGERVEPATSTLWVWVIAAGDVVLPLRMEWVAIVLGLVGAGGGLALATFGSARLFRSRGATGVLVPAGAAVVAAVPPFWEFATSGLEGGLTFGWIGLTGWLLCRWAASGERFGAAAAVAVGAAPLVRPDLALALPLVLGGVLAAQWPDDRPRDRVRLLAQALALPVAYQVFRMGFYGSLVPNTALAKSSGRGQWRTGWWYLRDFAEPYWLLLPLACLVLGVGAPLVGRAWRAGDRRGLVALGALPLLGLADGLYVVRLGGDYMHGRLLLPALFALLTPLAAVPVTRLGGLWPDRPGSGGRRRVGAAGRPRDPGRAAAAPPGRGRRGVGRGAGVGRDRRGRAAPPRRRRRRRACSCPRPMTGTSRYTAGTPSPPRTRAGPPRTVRRVLDSGVAVRVPRPIEGANPRDGGGGRSTRAGASGWSATPSARTCTSSTCSASPTRSSAGSRSSVRVRRATRSRSRRPGWRPACPTARCPRTCCGRR